MQTTCTRILYGGLIGLIWSCLVLGPTAAALAQSPSGQPDGSPQAAAEFSHEELQAFARAFAKAGKIRETLDADMAKAQTIEEKKTLVQKADAQIIQIVKQEGLSVKVFTQILKAVRSDKQLRDRVTGYLNEIR